MLIQLRQNLNQLMTEHKINANELARRTGLPASTIKKIRNSDNPNPTVATLLPLSHYFSVTLSQLIGDKATQAKETTMINTYKQIPILSWEKAIHWYDQNRKNYTTVTTEQHYSANAYALIVEESGWTDLAPGTTLFIDPEVRPIHRDFVIVYKEGQVTPTLKQIVFDEESPYLKPIVSGYKTMMLTPDHKFLGVVMEYRKQTRTVDNIGN